MERFNALGKFEFMDNGVFVIFGTTVGDNYNDFTMTVHDMFTAKKFSKKVEIELAYNLFVLDYFTERISNELGDEIINNDENDNTLIKVSIENIRDTYYKTIGEKYEKYFKLTDYSFFYFMNEIFLTEKYIVIEHIDDSIRSRTIRYKLLDRDICNNLLEIIDKIIIDIMNKLYPKNEIEQQH